MNRTSITFKISISLACLVVSVLLAAQTIGFFPDAKQEQIHAQLALCETIAIHTSLAIQHGQESLMQDCLRGVVDRNPTIAYAQVWHDSESLAEFPSDTMVSANERQSLTIVKVPIATNNRPWGTVELGLRPRESGAAWLTSLLSPFARFLVFCGCACIPAFFVYLRRLLQHLDPSTIVPDRVRTTLNTLAEGLVVVDRDQRIVLANNALSAMLESTPEELLGHDITTYAWMFDDEELQDDELPWAVAMEQKKIIAGQVIQLIGSSGQRRTLRVNASPIDGARKGCEGALVSFDDVTLLEDRNTALTSMLDRLRASRDRIQSQNRELTVLATQDSLTGALNRRCFMQGFETRWSRAHRDSLEISCIMIDVDHFKTINDRYGHAAGDTVLKHVVIAAAATIRRDDILCRYGGEEFCVLAPGTSPAEALQLADQLRQAIAKIRIQGISTITASLGVSSSLYGADSPNEMLNQADAALYYSKRTGRNRSTCWGEIKNNTNVMNAAGVECISTGAVDALMNALRNRDPLSEAHCRRVADLCVAASENVLSQTDRNLLKNAALLHDIGKLFVPDSILLKNGPLTDAEMDVIRTYHRTGIEIVRATFGCNELADLIMHHHSKLRNVPIAARLLSIVVAYDAMTNDCSYRETFSQQDAIGELNRLAGKEYDPLLVRHFVAFLTGERPEAPKRQADGTRPPIEKQLESLTMALDKRDTPRANRITEDILVAARQSRNPAIIELAETLQESTHRDGQWLESVRLTVQLMDLCRDARQAAMSQQELVAVLC